ncbi:hypothetical protein SteCoe_14907 [Stentor coeruleus]|uniref:Uncharacterized protein n=1 Tax=Stentor coeruleus TaxID=5963 RepID=A0A1R2C4T4_9CILI|nr:hypothetical protein SteCoe_14907 [Stentor coeruleus]
MVNYQDHQGSYKWKLGQESFQRAPRLKRTPLVIFPVTVVLALTLYISCKSTKIIVDSLPYWENRRTAKNLEKYAFDTCIAANSMPISQIKKHSAF